jgi:MurNAc alpha-1-phosphate uridylyltransferase
MKAMIFAAGLGTRLRPLTNDRPKALVEVGGKTMLEHTITHLKNAGFNHLVINIHHFGQQILDYLAQNNNFGVQIDISDERDYLLDTGGAIKKAQPFLQNEPFLIHNVDILSNADLKEIYVNHVESGALASLVVSRRDSARRLLFNAQNQLTGWTNIQTGEIKTFYPLKDYDPKSQQSFSFSGIHVMSPRIFDYMEDWTGKFPIIQFYLSICPKTEIRPHVVDHLQLIDMGKPETLQEAEAWLKENR